MSNGQNEFNEKGTGENPYYENLLKMQTDDPEAYAKLKPAEKMAVGFYAESKEKREKEKNQNG